MKTLVANPNSTKLWCLGPILECDKANTPMFLSAVNRPHLAVFKCVPFTDAFFPTFIRAKLWWTKHISAKPKCVIQTDLTKFLRRVWFLIACIDPTLPISALVRRKHGSELGLEHSVPLCRVTDVVVDVMQNIIRETYACGAWCPVSTQLITGWPEPDSSQAGVQHGLDKMTPAISLGLSCFKILWFCVWFPRAQYSAGKVSYRQAGWSIKAQWPWEVLIHPSYSLARGAQALIPVLPAFGSGLSSAMMQKVLLLSLGTHCCCGWVVGSVKQMTRCFEDAPACACTLGRHDNNVGLATLPCGMLVWDLGAIPGRGDPQRWVIQREDTRRTSWAVNRTCVYVFCM